MFYLLVFVSLVVVVVVLMAVAVGLVCLHFVVSMTSFVVFVDCFVYSVIWADFLIAAVVVVVSHVILSLLDRFVLILMCFSCN